MCYYVVEFSLAVCVCVCLCVPLLFHFACVHPIFNGNGRSEGGTRIGHGCLHFHKETQVQIYICMVQSCSPWRVPWLSMQSVIDFIFVVVVVCLYVLIKNEILWFLTHFDLMWVFPLLPCAYTHFTRRERKKIRSSACRSRTTCLLG